MPKQPAHHLALPASSVEGKKDLRNEKLGNRACECRTRRRKDKLGEIRSRIKSGKQCALRPSQRGSAPGVSSPGGRRGGWRLCGAGARWAVRARHLVSCHRSPGSAGRTPARAGAAAAALAQLAAKTAGVCGEECLVLQRGCSAWGGNPGVMPVPVLGQANSLSL